MPQQRRKGKRRNRSKRTSKIDQRCTVDQYFQQLTFNPDNADRTVVLGNTSISQIFAGLAVTTGMTCRIKSISIDLAAESAGNFSVFPAMVKTTDVANETAITNGTNNALVGSIDQYLDDQFATRRLTNLPITARVGNHGAKFYSFNRRIKVPQDICRKIENTINHPNETTDFQVIHMAHCYADANMVMDTIFTFVYKLEPNIF